MLKEMLVILTILLSFVNLFGKVITIGKASYVDKKPIGQSGPHQDKPYITENIKGGLPSNKWFSSILWTEYSEAMYPLPLTFSCSESGYWIGFPEINVFKEGDGDTQIVMPHFPQFSITGNDFNPKDARLDKYTDFAIDILMTDGNKRIKATVVRGSPFVFFNFENLEIILNFIEKATIWYGNEHSDTLGLTINNVNFAIFAPRGSKWKNLKTSNPLLQNPKNKNFISIALLPDNTKKTLELFKKYAFAFPTNTIVEWKYDKEKSKVITKYSILTESRQDNSSKTLMALFPHHWRNQKIKTLDYTYNSIRGTMKLIEGNEFITEHQYFGVLPWLPDVTNYDRKKLKKYIDDVYKKKDYIRYGPSYAGILDPYSLSKNLSRLADLTAIAEQLGYTDAKNEFVNTIKQTIEDYFTATETKSKKLFWYETNWGTMIMFDAGFGNNTELNDHHFHFGYFIYGATAVALQNPEWAKDENYGAMMKLLIKDIANYDRNDKMFPYMRYFDLYEGHSWASGGAPTGFSVFGPNQESVTEAINAWTALILWGEIIGDEKIRDLGVFLYSTEVNAALEYWYDIHKENFPPDYQNVEVCQIWGGKIAHTTWWTEEYTQTKAINILPLNGGSLFFSRYPDFVNENLKELYAKVGEKITIWPDIIAMYQAFTDPDKATLIWDQSYPPEFGNSFAKTYHWIENLKTLGRIEPDIYANTPLYAVFTKNGKKTYVVYNASKTNITVTFSDGKILNVPSLTMFFEN